jgi:hypothetical protein
MRFVQCRAAHNEKSLIPRFPKSVLRQRTIHPEVDGRSVIMLLSAYAIKPKNNKGGGHGDHWDRRLLALWNDVH